MKIFLNNLNNNKMLMLLFQTFPSVSTTDIWAGVAFAGDLSDL